MQGQHVNHVNSACIPAISASLSEAVNGGANKPLRRSARNMIWHPSTKPEVDKVIDMLLAAADVLDAAAAKVQEPDNGHIIAEDEHALEPLHTTHEVPQQSQSTDVDYMELDHHDKMAAGPEDPVCVEKVATHDVAELECEEQVEKVEHAGVTSQQAVSAFQAPVHAVKTTQAQVARSAASMQVPANHALPVMAGGVCKRVSRQKTGWSALESAHLRQ